MNEIIKELEESPDYAETMEALEQAKNDFESEFGESVYNIKIVPKSQSSEINTSENLKKMEDTMVRRIEAHLLGLDLPSLDFGVDHEYIEARNRENSQVFDQETYEKQKDQSRLDSMSKYGR